MDTDTSFLDVWNDVVSVQSAPPSYLVLATALAGLAVVAFTPAWRLARNVVTIAHEGGHALVALLSGRQLSGIRLHSDTSGVTVSRGKPTGIGMVLTVFAGYVAPSLIGFTGAFLLTNGRITALLWMTIVLLALMLVMIRNIYGVLSVVGTGALVFGVSWYTPDEVQAAFAYAFVWFLLFAGVRPVFELQRQRAGGRAPQSDPDQLARLTRTPATLWVGLFLLVNIAALLLGGRWLAF
ncbi:M50 family metallopeptidase [Allonocardiopsis opalescens]|uniref:Peptidase M50B-like protein n=1 Tax=Allonocardiopsis opalescens TaxID=1144618 RepID=A0A2T0QCK0_9ACTN|nr:M50 family metallopeptidase [Allonocardiopsis opalescens]PRY01647.1 peptidase M50B-like protein [Allonocardiopsis opalescens]